MVNTEYKIAYSEVLEILKYISKEEQKWLRHAGD